MLLFRGLCSQRRWRKWIRPRLDDIQDVKEQQILPCKVMGEWDFSFRTAVFIIQNAPEIQARFDELFSI